jgi:hypothetical protein
MSHLIPCLNTRFACIIDHEQIELAALISSYISEVGSYVPFFEFPSTSSASGPVDTEMVNEHTPSRIRAEEFDVFVGNALLRMGKCEYLILAGLSAEQKSYLRFLGHFTVIEVATLSDVPFALFAFRDEERPVLPCLPEQALIGLYHSILEQRPLRFTSDAPTMEAWAPDGKSLIVVEKHPFISPVLAVHYACAVQSAIAIVDEMKQADGKLVPYLLEGWKNGDISDYEQVVDWVNSRVGAIDFTRYESATFFTIGLPYSLVLRNVIPMCYVHLNYRPDLFIINSILKEASPSAKAALVFSPKEFKIEETSGVITRLRKEHLYVRPLIGKDATVHNLDMHVKEFPYDWLHICSHGGEVSGYIITERFTDRDGHEHIVEYDEVVGFAPQPGKELIPVHRKTIFRKFDGYVWGSAAFRYASYPQYVFADMQNAMSASFRGKEKPTRVYKAVVADSCAIKCHGPGGNYQALLQTVGAHGAPVVFNNSCWSAFGIAESFLVAGARGYIGTLWGVDNAVAVGVAESFYSQLFQGTVLDAIHAAGKETLGSTSAYIYVYWGLPFTRLQPIQDADLNRYRVFLQHYEGSVEWKYKADESDRPASREIMEQLSLWNAGQIQKHFPLDEMQKLRERYRKMEK